MKMEKYIVTVYDGINMDNTEDYCVTAKSYTDATEKALSIAGHGFALIVEKEDIDW